MTNSQIAAFAWLCTVSGIGLAKQPDLSSLADAPQVWVRLQDLSGTPADLIESASQETTRIFRDFGIHLEWLSCGGISMNPVCFEINGPSALDLRLLNRNTRPLGVRKGVFGFAAMSTRGLFATVAYVYVDCVDEVSDGRKNREHILLGAIMAHEIGHLLLGIRGHAKWGLMKSPWGPSDLRSADRRMLKFSRDEARRMREFSRARLAESTISPGLASPSLEAAVFPLQQ